MKLRKMMVFYAVLCEKLKNKRPLKIMEYLVFLVQCDSLSKFKSPLIPYPIYIFRGEVKIPYISDLCRVSNIFFISGSGYNEIFNPDKNKIKLFNKYKKFTNEEIETLALKKIQEIDKNSKCFYFSEYENKWLRLKARHVSNEMNHIFGLYVKRMLATLVVSLSLMYMCIFLGMVFNLSVIEKLDLSRIFGTFIIFIVMLLFYFAWTWKWTRPTEIEKNYKAFDSDKPYIQQIKEARKVKK